MLVTEKIVDDKPRLEYKYKIQSGASPIKSYGLALARCLRFPTSLIGRAEEVVTQVEDESFFNKSRCKENVKKPGSKDETLNTTTTSSVASAMADLDKDVIDLYSYVLLLMNSDKGQEAESMNIAVINQKLKSLIEKMTPEFREFVKISSLQEVINALNLSKVSSSSDK